MTTLVVPVNQKPTPRVMDNFASARIFRNEKLALETLFEDMKPAIKQNIEFENQALSESKDFLRQIQAIGILTQALDSVSFLSIFLSKYKTVT